MNNDGVHEVDDGASESFPGKSRTLPSFVSRSGDVTCFTVVTMPGRKKARFLGDALRRAAGGGREDAPRSAKCIIGRRCPRRVAAPQRASRRRPCWRVSGIVVSAERVGI